MSYEYDYTGAVQTETLPAGRYRIECWGAAGGTVNTSYPGGKGGYSVGILTLSASTTLYIYVGQEGQQGTTFNIGHTKTYSNTKCKNGGGATDVRIGTDDLYHRVIVAGGGGGASYYSATSCGLGGVGGGSSGGDGTSRTSDPDAYGRGGSQIAGGANGIRTNSSMTLAAFGVGGFPQAANYSDASGGGGWYGGGCGGRENSRDYCEAGGGGGSGWVYTLSTYAVWNAGNPTDAAGWGLTTAHCLENAQTLAGDQSFPAVDGGTETGHEGNGYVRITPADTTPPTVISVSLTPNPVNTGASFLVNVGFAQYTVTYNTNSGSCSTPSEAVLQGSDVTLPTATKEPTTQYTYTLSGWYTASSGGTRVGGAGDSYTPTENITLYAQWTQATRTYAVNFYKYDGGGTWSLSASLDVEYNTSVSCGAYAGNLCDTSHYTCGWYTSTTTSTRTAKLDGTITVTGAMTLYERYRGKVTSVRAFNMSAGSTATRTESASCGSKLLKAHWRVGWSSSYTNPTRKFRRYTITDLTDGSEVSAENEIVSGTSGDLFIGPDVTISSGSLSMSYDIEYSSDSEQAIVITVRLTSVSDP